MNAVTLLLVLVCVVLLIGGLPQVSGHWHNLGYGPSSLVLVLIIVIIVLLVR